jgi:acetyl esterase/lipase
VRYIRTHAAELGVDPNKIIVSDGSAGGHVAAGTALFDEIDHENDDQLVSSVPAALVLLFLGGTSSSRGDSAGK